MINFDESKMLYTIPKEKHGKDELIAILKEHEEVKFVSYAGLDMIGNDTDERIPIKLFFSDTEEMLTSGVQTDGSSVALPKIADINNGMISMVPDFDVNWYVDYNFSNIDKKTGLPVGTLRIPAFLLHNGEMVGSRSVLKKAEDDFKKNMLSLIKKHPYCLDGMGIKADDIDSIVVTSATELEFWVRTPDDQADREQLSTSQELKEQYWKRTYGPVRTALEESILFLDNYGLGMEMGHKEVGGIKSKLNHQGNHDHIMEQLEIDWKFSTPMQVADNEKHVKYVVRDIFSSYALVTSFMAKPIEGVAGSGEHTHFGVQAKLKNGKIVNLFNAPEFDKNYLSPIGYGALMGILKNYEVINPFVSSTIDSFNRLKPGYEAPVCTVTSLGKSYIEPSRNRTILIGLVREKNKPLATRFELRSPNPKSNTYLVLAAMMNAAYDGIKASLEKEKSSKDLEKSMSKKYGEKDFYLETEREYRTELNVFNDYKESDRQRLFGKAPKTVYENILALKDNPEKVKAVMGSSFDETSIESYIESVLSSWATELHSRIIPNDMKTCLSYEKKHTDTATDYDLENWKKICELKTYIAKDSLEEKSLLTRIREALDKGNYQKASKLQVELNDKMSDLHAVYSKYKKNLF